MPGQRPTSPPAGGVMAARVVRVLVADSSPVYRRGLQTVLAREPDIRIIGEAGTMADAIAEARSLAPDVVLLDPAMPLTDADDWAAVRALLPKLRLCLLLPDGDGAPAAVAESLRLLAPSADGYLARGLPVEELAPSLRAVFAGRPVLSPTLAVTLMPTLLSPPVPASPAPAPPQAELPVSGPVAGGTPPGALLTERELDVLRLLAEGLANKQVGERLFISENTVRNHVRHILDKLHVRSRTEAALYAVRNRVVDMPPAPSRSR